MRRRELLKLFSVAVVAPVIPPELFAMMRQAQPASGYSLRTFNPDQNEAVLAMIDLIIPATDTPGAKGARVNEFIDVILTEWATPDERQHFLDGIAEVDTQSQKLFSNKFVEAHPEQQLALLESMDGAIDWTQESGETDEWSPAAFDRQLQGKFFRVLKGITLHGYYTSEIGFAQALKLEIIPGAQHGCVPVNPEKKA
jgi:Gluconate 2-dehydrogenase subunit 3